METVTLDVPLFIRLLEQAREDIKTDADLHKLVERVLEAQRNTEGPLTMTNYQAVESKSVLANVLLRLS
jgi:hypothetical protein